MDDLMRLSVVDQARLVRLGEVSPAELVEAAIAAVERLNPAVNAVVLKMYDEARAHARGVNRDAPFAGVPPQASSRVL